MFTVVCFHKEENKYGMCFMCVCVLTSDWCVWPVLSLVTEFGLTEKEKERRVEERRGEEWRHGLGEMSNYNNTALFKMVSHSGLDSVVKFHFIQTATTICYCGEEIGESIDNRSDDEVGWGKRAIGGEESAECSVLSQLEPSHWFQQKPGASWNNIDPHLTHLQWHTRHS